MKVIYTGLALLLGVGLVGFGVGSVGGGSIFESLSKEGRGGNGYAAKVTAARKRIAKNPNDAAAWIALTEAQLHEANSSEDYESATERYTAKGLQQLRHVASSWERYLQVAGAHPSVKLARLVSNIFLPLGQPANAVKALQIEIAGSPPSATLYYNLAEFSYIANNMHQGDVAGKKAISLMPKARRPLAEQELESIKKAVIKRNKKKGTTAGATSTSSTSTTSKSSAATSKKK